MFTIMPTLIFRSNFGSWYRFRLKSQTQTNAGLCARRPRNDVEGRGSKCRCDVGGGLALARVLTRQAGRRMMVEMCAARQAGRSAADDARSLLGSSEEPAGTGPTLRPASESPWSWRMFCETLRFAGPSPLAVQAAWLCTLFAVMGVAATLSCWFLLADGSGVGKYALAFLVGSGLVSLATYVALEARKLWQVLSMDLVTVRSEGGWELFEAVNAEVGRRSAADVRGGSWVQWTSMSGPSWSTDATRTTCWPPLS